MQDSDGEIRRRSPEKTGSSNALGLHIAILALLSILVLSSPVQAQSEAGEGTWEAGDTAAVLAQWSEAASAGDPRAMLALGRIYRSGLGASQDNVQAFKWLSLAASRGEVEAAAELDALAGDMSPEDRAEGQRLVRTWQPGTNSDPPRPGDGIVESGAADSPPPGAVREAQRLLAILGHAPGMADGIWGRRSAAAYQAFLHDAGLPATSALTPEALLAMRAIAGRKGRDEGTASAELGASVEDAPPPQVVRSAQELLTELGYAPGPADGVWGRRSARAYQAFLRDAGMPSENALTPEALLVMRAIADRHNGRPDTGAFPIADSPGQALLQQVILEAQELLEILGYGPGPADGVWGRRSASAYRAFFRDAGLPPEDALTPDGLRALRARAGSQVAADALPAEDAALQDAVREAQELLARLGYDPGPVDGTWGTRSEMAYRAFLREAGLPPGDALIVDGLLALRALAGTLDSDGGPSGARPEGAGSPHDALRRAAISGDLDALKAALDAGAPIDARDGQGWTLLMHVASAGNPLLLEPLLGAGADLNIRAPDGATALLLAVALRHDEIVVSLMKSGADVSVPGPDGRTAVDAGRARYGDSEAARMAGRDPAIIALLEGRTWAEAVQDAEEAERVARKWLAGTEFRDCPLCPAMVVVPSGSFMMGSPAGEAGRFQNEGPAHRVALSRPFGVGIYEIRRREFGRFVAETGHAMGDSCWTDELGEWKVRLGRSWTNPGFAQGDRHPAVCVSWEDAKSYVEWLSQRSGEAYRLLSESEWEHAARAGTEGPFHFGSAISTDLANFDDTHARRLGRTGAYRRKTVPAGTYPANGFKLHDMHGNVWEWVEDCWHDSYEGAPSNGSAWTDDDDCTLRTLRGGAWDGEPPSLRAAARVWSTTGNRIATIGFRVARDLSP